MQKLNTPIVNKNVEYTQFPIQNNPWHVDMPLKSINHSINNQLSLIWLKALKKKLRANMELITGEQLSARQVH